MKGWKTWSAGLGGIFSGLALAAMSLTGDGGASISDGINLIIGGLGVIGIGHKIDKSAR